MLSTAEQKEICALYSQPDEFGFVQCSQCPLVISVYWCICHANSHYDRDECEFVLDDATADVSNYPNEPMYKEEYDE